MGLLRKVYSLFVKESKYYPRGMNTLIDSSIPELVEIGDGFISAPGSIILAHDASTITHSGKSCVEKTIIGRKVFLGANAVVLPGITIGEGSIIGAGAVVTKDVPSYSVAVGNPAKVTGTVQEYISKCEERGVLYDLTPAVAEKHGKGLRYTEDEKEELRREINRQYNERNK